MLCLCLPEALCTEVVGGGGSDADDDHEDVVGTTTASLLGVNLLANNLKEEGDPAQQRTTAMLRLREQIAAATIPLSIANALPFALISSSHGMTLTTDSTMAMVGGGGESLLALPTSGGLVPIRINSSLLKTESGLQQQRQQQQQQQQQQHYVYDAATGIVTAVGGAPSSSRGGGVMLKTTTTTVTSSSSLSTVTTTTPTTMTRILPSLSSRPAPRTDILLQTAREVLQLPDDPSDYRRVFTGRSPTFPPRPRDR
jgi:hypothetical protein